MVNFLPQYSFVSKRLTGWISHTMQWYAMHAQIFSCGAQLNIWPCMSVCLFVPIFFYIIEEVIEVDELDDGNISAAAGK